MRCLWMIVVVVGLSSCATKATKAECKKMASQKVAVYFAKASAKVKKNASKHELAASLEECLASWSQSEAKCAAKAKDRAAFLACRN